MSNEKTTAIFRDEADSFREKARRQLRDLHPELWELGDFHAWDVEDRASYVARIAGFAWGDHVPKAWHITELDSSDSAMAMVLIAPEHGYVETKVGWLVWDGDTKGWSKARHFEKGDRLVFGILDVCRPIADERYIRRRAKGA